MEEAQGGYWNEIAAQADTLPAGWRRHARQAHLALLDRWVGQPRGVWLKTDLYEERQEARALLPHLRSATWVGMDVAPRTVERSGFVRALSTDVRQLAFADGCFDGVLSTSTLDHFDNVSDIAASLAELRRVTADGGTLVVTFDNPDNPLIRARNALPHHVAGRTGLVPFAVGATLGADDGAAALQIQGWEVLDTTFLLHAPHVVGTRLAKFRYWEQRVLPQLDRAVGARASRRTGHYVAFLARAN